MTDYEAIVKPLIHWLPVGTGSYYAEEIPKTTIYLHHTAGNADPAGVIKFWNSMANHVATAFVIGGNPRLNTSWNDGDLYQCFSSKHWAYHLGLHEETMPPGHVSNKIINAQAVAIEICNWGPLTLRNGQYLTYLNGVIPAAEVTDLGTSYRGFQYWHKYTDAQLATVKLLLLYLTQKYNIPRAYKGDRMFTVIPEALGGNESGIWTHTSVRQDKTDCYPDPRLIAILKEVAATD